MHKKLHILCWGAHSVYSVWYGWLLIQERQKYEVWVTHVSICWSGVGWGPLIYIGIMEPVWRCWSSTLAFIEGSFTGFICKRNKSWLYSVHGYSIQDTPLNLSAVFVWFCQISQIYNYFNVLMPKTPSSSELQGLPVESKNQEAFWSFLRNVPNHDL